jgi:hypothetical protein
MSVRPTRVARRGPPLTALLPFRKQAGRRRIAREGLLFSREARVGRRVCGLPHLYPALLAPVTFALRRDAWWNVAGLRDSRPKALFGPRARVTNPGVLGSLPATTISQVASAFNSGVWCGSWFWRNSRPVTRSCRSPGFASARALRRPASSVAHDVARRGWTQQGAAVSTNCPVGEEGGVIALSGLAVGRAGDRANGVGLAQHSWQPERRQDPGVSESGQT